MTPARLFAALALVTCLGCASSPPSEPADPSQVTSESDEPTSEGEGEAAAPASKSEQCAVLGEAIESGIAGGTSIVSLNDRARLEELAEEWKVTVARVEGVDSDLPELATLRDELVTLAKGMHEALTTTAGTGSDADRKAALARYHELNGEVDALVDRFNQVCG